MKSIGGLSWFFSLWIITYSCFSFGASGFDVVTLGARGGIEDGNLTAFLVKPHAQQHYLALDAGTLVNGLIKADQQGAFNELTIPADSDLTRVGYILNQHIVGYFISHAHLDHIAGLIIASPDDNRKPIYALPSVNQLIEKNYFNWQSWPNFADRGQGHQLKQYQYIDLPVGEAVAIADTTMKITAYPLSHGGTESSAVLVERDDQFLLFFGDTGPDAVEKSDNLRHIWQQVAAHARTKALKAIIIEVSYTDQQPDHKLYGHLTPQWLLHSLKQLETFAGGKGSIAGLPVVISHIKYSLEKHISPQDLIWQQLAQGNDMGVKFILPQQGMRWHFN